MASPSKVCYTVKYPDHDALGARIEMRGPNDCDFRCIAQINYPECRVRIKITEDGAYAFRHIIIGPHGDSEPTEEICQIIDTPYDPNPGTSPPPCPPKVCLPTVKDTLDDIWG